MIHGSSTDPVYIKKIYLKVWTLRDEITAIIKKRIDAGEDPKSLDLEKLIREYKSSGPLKSGPDLSVIEGGADNDLRPSGGATNQDDIAAQMAQMAGMDDDELAEAEAEAAAGDAADSPAAGSEEGRPEQQHTIIQRGSHNLPEDKIHKGMCVLSELGMDHFYFFSEKNFLEGQSVVIEFLVPKRFVMNVDVAYSRPYNMRSRVISEARLPFRVAAKFSFLKEGERTLLRQFVQSIEPEIEEVVSAPKVSAGDGGGDDFDELDDLDL